jgi:hypothetical protein
LRRILNLLLRVHSYLFQGFTSLLLLGLGSVVKISGQHNLKLDMLPWKGETLTNWLLGLGVVGLVATFGAVRGGVLRYLFPLASLYFTYLTITGFFLGGYNFDGSGHFYSIVAYAAGAVGSSLASLMQLKKKP